MPLSAERSAGLRVLGVAVLALASWWLPKLALPACFLVLLVAISLPKLRERRARLWARTALVLTGVAATGAFAGFVVHEAIPGVIAGGNQDNQKRAVAFLRTLVVAQDNFRSKAWIDPDGDNVGAAGTFRELAGLSPLRSERPLASPPLYVPQSELEEVSGATVYNHAAYRYKLCLPTQAGGWSATSNTDGLDPEAAERRFVAYAWPRHFGAGNPTTVYAIDAYERIVTHEPKGTLPERYPGTESGPPCDATVASEADWIAWKHKAPRERLPGE